MQVSATSLYPQLRHATSYSYFFCSPAFSRKIVVLAGDGRQIPPVIPSVGQSETCAASILSSSYYSGNPKVRNLTKTMRKREDPSFSSMVGKIRDGLPLPDSDGLVDTPGVLTEVDLQSSLDFVFSPVVLADPVSCCKHFVVTLHNDTLTSSTTSSSIGFLANYTH